MQLEDEQTAGSGRGEESDRSGRLGPLWRGVLLLVASASITLLVLELLLAAADVYPPVPYTYVGDQTSRPSEHFQPDDRVGWLMHPGVRFLWTTEERSIGYHADARGFRIAGGTKSDRSQDPVVVLAGDSYVWGLGVEYERSIAGILADELGSARIVNLAQPGYGLDQVMLSLQYFAPEEKPDLIVVGLFDDDFRRSLYAYRDTEGFSKPAFRLEDGALVAKTRADRPGRLLSIVERRSRLFGLLRRSSWKAGERLGVGPWWTLNRAVLDAMRSIANELNCSLLFVYVPWMDWRTFPALASYMQATGSAFIDPVAASPERPGELYFPTDTHLNDEGNRYMAERILEWVDRTIPSLR